MTWWHHESVPKHVRAGFGYAEDVCSGKIVAGAYTKAACQRSLDWANSPPSGTIFDLEKAAAPCRYIEKLRHTKGAWARGGGTIVLEPWQCWMLIVPFGFVFPNGTRLIRTCYWEVARKNAKSTTSAGVGLFLMSEDGEPGAEVYSAATTREQASIVFQQARQQEIMSPHPGVNVLAHRLEVTDKTHPSFGGTFRALHAEGSTMDGLNISAALCDELHAWRRRDVFEVIETATSSRDQSLIWCITTAGVNFEGVCYDTRGYMVQLLEGSLNDSTFWGNIWTIDKGDDWRDREVWPKANPNLNVSVYELDLERKAKKAESITSEQSAFMNKHLNVWTNSASSWMNMSRWDGCGDSSLNIDDFVGEDCWTGADLASKNDMAALAILFKRQIDGVDHIYQFVKNYLPERAVMESANAGHYDGWVRSGHLICTPGVVLDVGKIEADTLGVNEKHPIRECCFDPMHNATQYGVNMQAAGLNTVEVRPTVANFSEPMKYMEAKVRAGEWHHSHDPCLTWQVSNVEVKLDFKDNIFPRKPQSGQAAERKIDGLIATIIAYNRLLADESPTVFDRDLIVL